MARAGREPASSLKAGETAPLVPEAALLAIPVTGHSAEPLPAHGGGHRHMIRISRNWNKMAPN